MYIVFYSAQGPGIQFAVPKGKGGTGKFYPDKVLKKLKWYNGKRRPNSGIKNIILFHDNAPSHRASIDGISATGKGNSSAPSPLFTRPSPM